MTRSTKDRKEEMKGLWLNGLTYEEIGQRFGISKQRVYQIIGGHHSPRYARISEEMCVYPNLRKYLNENRVGVRELTRLLYGYYHEGLDQRVRKALKGVSCRKDLIDRILAVTGMTYEKVFEREGGGSDDKIH